ncbi:RNA polymerase-binding transcription factor DksA [Gammaproteobacteria bacterium]
MAAPEILIPKTIPYQEEPGEPYMSERQRVHFRHLLLAWKQQLMEEVDRTVAHMQVDATHYPDPNDRATQESDFSIELRARDRERKLLRKIGEALRDIETGDYGYCEACGAEIGLRRLEARLTATLCIECKTLQESHERAKG